MAPPSMHVNSLDEDPMVVDASSPVDPEVAVPRVHFSNVSSEGSVTYSEGDEPVTIRERQEALNISHPFGVRLWKPALYKKDRSISRVAFQALHSTPSKEYYITFGNILWLILFGWWVSLLYALTGLILCILSFASRLTSSFFAFFTQKDSERPHCPIICQYVEKLWNVAWYIIWPFGKYVELEKLPESNHHQLSSGFPASEDVEVVSEEGTSETTSLIPTYCDDDNASNFTWDISSFAYYVLLVVVIAPVQLIISAVCWFFVFSIPMAKLNWVLLSTMYSEPLRIQCKSGATFASSTSDSGILLCTYHAFGVQYYKYTYDGVNVFFYNLLILVAFAIVNSMWLTDVFPDSPTSHPGILFTSELLSVIPLAYFIGMAVSSISAQSSYGMAAVLNATFGSIVEVILYMFAIKDGKAVLVEGAIIGSILCSTLILPGISMFAGGLRYKEQQFNIKSAGVTSTLLIMSVIGAFTPTMFHQKYGSFSLNCSSCDPTNITSIHVGVDCTKCFYTQPNPFEDPIFQDYTRPLIYFCTAVLPTAYIIGLLFTLRTHVNHIYHQHSRHDHHSSNHHLHHHYHSRSLHSAPSALEANIPILNSPQLPRVSSKDSLLEAISGSSGSHENSTNIQEIATDRVDNKVELASSMPCPPTHSFCFTTPLQSPNSFDARHIHGSHHFYDGHEEEETPGGHDSPNWSRSKSYFILVSCTILFAILAELLVHDVDVVLETMNVGQKFLGLTIFTWIPSFTEILNAVAFAMYGNIPLSLEIGSAYVVQILLLQIPILVIFSTVYNANTPVADLSRTFTLLFSQWDAITVFLSVFLLSYVYIEGKSTYFKGSILTLAYCVFLVSFAYVPLTG